jgi:hypothetical protein
MINDYKIVPVKKADFNNGLDLDEVFMVVQVTGRLDQDSVINAQHMSVKWDDCADWVLNQKYVVELTKQNFPQIATQDDTVVDTQSRVGFQR